MKQLTKQVHTILYSMHDLLWVVIGLLLLLGVILIASSDSWLYLFLIVLFLVCLYQSKGIRFIKNKNSKLGRQMDHFKKQIRTIFHTMHSRLSVVVGGFIKNKKLRAGHELKRFIKRIHAISHGMHDLMWVVIGLLLLLVVILIASIASLPYLFLFGPLLVYLYHSKGIRFMKNKI